MIGIVGGVGPYAGLDLMKKVFENTLAGNDQDHLDIILLSIPSSIPDRTDYLLGKVRENPGLGIAEVLKRIEQSGADLAGIPCNTAHADEIFMPMMDELQRAGSKIRVLHMIKETVSYIVETYPEISRVGIITTSGSVQSGVYVKELLSLGLEAFTPPSEMQDDLIHSAIYHPEYGLKSTSDPVQPRAIENLMEGFRYLKGKGAEAVILGCNEITSIFSEKNIDGVVAIDPTTVLARALIREEDPGKLKPNLSDMT
jgi:aspartate racemase